MQRNLLLIGIVIFILFFGGVVLFKKRISQPVSTSSVNTTNVPSKTSGMVSPTVQPQVANISVTSPKDGDSVQFPMIIIGKARVFENVLNYRITDENGATLSSGNTMADSPDAGKFGTYTITIKDLKDFTAGKISIEVFQNSAKDGSEIDKITVPVTLQ